MSDTPLCDAVLSAPIGVPPGLETALRGVERDARHARAGLRALAERDGAVLAVHTALERLDTFLEDRSRSPLLRALRRPLWQIALGTVAWRRLESAWRAVVLQAAAATRLQHAVQAVGAEVARVEGRFGVTLPYWTREILARHRVTAAHAEALPRDDARNAFLDRLARAEAELDELARHLPPPGTPPAERGERWPDGVAPGELLAAAARALAERLADPAPAGVAVRLRAGAARHLHALGTAAGWERGGAGAEHSVAEQLANAALAVDGATVLVDDAPLWAGLIEASQDVLHAPRQGAWQAQLHPSATPSGGAEAWGTTHFVLPIAPGHALITPEHPTAVRVTSRRVALDAEVECAAFTGTAGFETVERARREVAPLFDGLGGDPAWYHTARTARLTVIARAGAEWLARVDRLGELSAVSTAAWNDTAPREARLRVLLDGVSPPSEAVTVGATEGGVAELGGVETRLVETPFARVRRAWLKSVSGDGGDARVEAEHAFFRRLAVHAHGMGLVPLGRGRLERPVAEGRLYVPPFGLGMDDSPPLARWATSRPIGVVCALARLSVRLWRAGLALGLYHRAAFVFRVECTRGGVLRPLPVIVMAPFGAPLGEPRPELNAPELAPAFDGLGVRLLPPALARGWPATPGAEAQALVLFALDLLATQKLRTRARTLEGIARAAAEDPAACFKHPDTALHFVRALDDPRRALTLVESLARVGEASSA